MLIFWYSSNLEINIYECTFYIFRYYRAGTVRAQVLTRVHEMGSYGQYVLISILAK